jgi:hypothetical protein
MPLPNLERRLEELLVKALASKLGTSEDNMAETVCQPHNRLLRGGYARAFLNRTKEEAYNGFVGAILPCANCQESGGTFRLCHNNCVIRTWVDDIAPDDVPPEFSLDVGDDTVTVTVVEWTW